MTHFLSYKKNDAFILKEFHYKKKRIESNLSLFTFNP